MHFRMRVGGIFPGLQGYMVTWFAWRSGYLGPDMCGERVCKMMLIRGSVTSENREERGVEYRSVYTFLVIRRGLEGFEIWI